MNQIKDVNAKVMDQSWFVPEVLDEIGKVVVGQNNLIQRLLIGLLCHGHVLIEGVPGLAKTLSVKTLAETIQARFQRIQFTPDLLPADLIGTMVYNPQSGQFSPRKGPVFSNIILADEINRAPAKVQSALLEAMQERQVTIGDTTHPLEDPFMVLATQNPIEQEGTYHLPEAQVDRFMLKVVVGYPNRKEEREIMERMMGGPLPAARPVLSKETLWSARELVHQIHLDDALKEYIVHMVFATREPANYRLDGLKHLIAYGASPRATIYLALTSQAHAYLNRRGYVIPEDIKAVAMDVLRHRIIVTYEAEAEELTSEDIIRQVLGKVEVP